MQILTYQPLLKIRPYDVYNISQTRFSTFFYFRPLPFLYLRHSFFAQEVLRHIWSQISGKEQAQAH